MAKSGKEPAAEGAGKKSAANKAVAGKSAANKSVSQKKATGKVKAVSAAPRSSGAPLIPVICSECHEDFMFDTGAKSDDIVCPVCEHAAGRPDDAALHHIAAQRSGEKKNFYLAFALMLFAGIFYFTWVCLMGNPANAADDGAFWGPLGLAILLLIGGTAMALKYEGARFEVYF